MTLARNIKESIEKSSWIRRMFEAGAELKSRFGVENVFDFSIGNPDIPPPEEFFRALKGLTANDDPSLHGYMPNAGFLETREAAAKIASEELGIELSGEHIVMTCGAAGGLNVLLKTILDPGDEVIVLKPYFVEYGFYIGNHNGRMVLADTDEDFCISIENIRKTLTPKTKAVIINSPNNPTGRVYPENSIKALADLLNEHSRKYNAVFLISDEPYRKIIYDGISVPSILKHYSNSAVVTSFSKTLSIPGERIGYIALNPACDDFESIMAGIIMCNRILGFVNAPAMIQRILTAIAGVSISIERYTARRDMLTAGLALAGYEYIKPDGAFYLFCKSPIEDDVAFVKHLQKFNILVVPGIGFGGPGYFRISYTAPESMIERSLKGFKEAIDTIG